MRRFLLPLAALLSLVLLWEVIVRVTDIVPYLLPPPSAVWTAFLEVREILPGHIATTMTEAVLGLVLGAVAGAAVAALLWAIPFVRRTLLPLLIASQTVPMVVLAPLLTLWFGLDLLPKVIVVALVTFFPVTVATVQGLASTDADLLELFRSMGATRLQLARLVLIPSAASAFFAGLRIGATYAVGAAVIGEWVGASSGLGLLITRSQASFRVDRLFVAVVVVAVLSALLFAFVNAIAHLVLPWQRDNKSPQSSLKGISL
jgi:putative hydroxymethylpyrimidine transport system permease protein